MLFEPFGGCHVTTSEHVSVVKVIKLFYFVSMSI